MFNTRKFDPLPDSDLWFGVEMLPIFMKQGSEYDNDVKNQIDLLHSLGIYHKSYFHPSDFSSHSAEFIAIRGLPTNVVNLLDEINHRQNGGIFGSYELNDAQKSKIKSAVDGYISAIAIKPKYTKTPITYDCQRHEMENLTNYLTGIVNTLREKDRVDTVKSMKPEANQGHGFADGAEELETKMSRKSGDGYKHK